MRVQTLALVWHGTLVDSRALSSTLNLLKFLMRADESFLSFLVTLDVLLTTLVLVWPELMIVNER